jgi:multiple sugar transport system substrate-binding protein
MDKVKSVLRGSFLLISLTIVGIIFLILFFSPFLDYREEHNPVQQIFYADNISPAHQALIDSFNTVYRGKIEVVPIDLPFTKFSTNERKELLARTLRSKSPRIDLFTVDVIWVPRFAKWCEPLDRFFPEDKRSMILDHVLTSSCFNSQLVSVPLYTDVSIMYYREDILRKLPDHAEIEQRLKSSITWEELIQLYYRLRESRAGEPFYIYPADNFEGLICSFFEGLASQNQFFLYNDSSGFNTREARKSLGLLVDLVHRHHMSPTDVTQFDEVRGYNFALARDAMIVRGWPGFLEHHTFPEEHIRKYVHIRRAALPHFQGGRPAFTYGGWNFMISKYSRKKDAAVRFIEFALEEENQKKLFKQGGYLPSTKAVYSDSLFLKQNPDLRFYQRIMKHGVHRPYLADYTKLSDVLSYYVHLAIKGEISVDEALNQASAAYRTGRVLIK